MLVAREVRSLRLQLSEHLGGRGHVPSIASGERRSTGLREGPEPAPVWGVEADVRSILMAITVVLAACPRQGDREHMNLNVSEESMVELRLSELGARRAEHDTPSLRAGYAQLAYYLCRLCPTCAEYSLPADRPPFSLSEAASISLSSNDAEERAAGLSLACAVCEEEHRPCVCDGRACEAEDLQVAGLDGIGWELECGVLVRWDGAWIPWGATVRAFVDRR